MDQSSSIWLLGYDIEINVHTKPLTSMDSTKGLRCYSFKKLIKTTLLICCKIRRIIVETL